MKTITFYSYKGGVGRTLALSNMASRLADLGKKVCIMDFDLEAPGLHYKFSDYLNESDLEKGLVDYVNDYVKNKTVPVSIHPYITDIKFQKKYKEPIFLLPAGGVYNNQYWQSLARINWAELLYNQSSSGIGLLLSLKNKIKKEVQPDYLLIDSRTGITEISGITLSLLADEIVLMSSSSKESLEGSKQVLKGVFNKKNRITGLLPKVHFVLSRIPFIGGKEDRFVDRVKNDINKFLKKNQYDTSFEEILVIHSDRDLELEESFKIDLNYMDASKVKIHPIYRDYIALFEAITKGDLLPAELEKFNQQKKLEFLIEKARNEKNELKRISVLKEAILLDPNSEEINYLLGKSYLEGGHIEKAIQYFKIVLKINPLNIELYNNLAIAYEKIGEYKMALEFIQKGLVLFPDNVTLLHNQGLMYRAKKEYDKAIQSFKNAIEIRPMNFISFNAYADVLRLKGEYDKALGLLYQSLEINPQEAISYGTLAEIQLEKGNLNEFFKNLELAFIFGLDFQKAVNTEPEIYKKVLNNQRFQNLLKKYNITPFFED